MANWQEQRGVFYKIAIEQALSSSDDFRRVFPLGCNVPEEKLSQWLRSLGRVPKDFSLQRRYVNRFKVGADPEFLFVRGVPGDQVRKAARELGLKQGVAFGADNNGRLTEIRPHPSRSAIEVCASILSTFRWLVLNRPQTLDYAWMAGAWALNDGLGGHIHFGRKRPTRAVEVSALDRIEESLLNIGTFPMADVERRRNGDEHGQQYGRLGDFRLQTHGYEYRTFPSWLETPELSFLSLTLGKLAVHDPEMTKWGSFARPNMTLIRLQNFLSYYKNRDDDARLALIVLKRGIPTHRGVDLKPNWGLTIPKADAARLNFGNLVIPSSIRPDAKDIQEIFEGLLGGKAPEWRTPTPTWSPIKPPDEYQMCLDRTDTMGKKGLGEMTWDLCSHKSIPIVVDSIREHGRYLLSVPKSLADMLPAKWLNQKEIVTHALAPWMIIVSKEATEGLAVKTTRRLLTEGVLPIWKLKDVKPESLSIWEKNVRQIPKSKAKKYSGRILYSSTGNNQIPGLVR